MADRGDGGDVDDGAAALLLHDRDDVLHGEERALEVNGEDAVPFGLSHLHHIAHLGNADIVVEHVDTAVSLHAGGDHGFHVGGAGDIGGKRCRLAAFGLDDVDRLLGG